jgi:hypothetical protein
MDEIWMKRPSHRVGPSLGVADPALAFESSIRCQAAPVRGRSRHPDGDRPDSSTFDGRDAAGLLLCCAFEFRSPASVRSATREAGRSSAAVLACEPSDCCRQGTLR